MLKSAVEKEGKRGKARLDEGLTRKIKGGGWQIWNGEVEKAPGNWLPGRLIEALCGSRFRAVTPMKSTLATFCRLCPEF